MSWTENWGAHIPTIEEVTRGASQTWHNWQKLDWSHAGLAGLGLGMFGAREVVTSNDSLDASGIIHRRSSSTYGHIGDQTGLTDRHIDARSIVTLVIFFVVNALVIFPIRIPLPYVVGTVASRIRSALVGPSPHTKDVDAGKAQGEPSGNGDDSGTQDSPGAGPNETTAVAQPRPYFKLGLETVPVIGVLLMLASTCIPGDVVRTGIVGGGHNGVRPYDIMALFLSFAYISLSLDCTGLLRYLAFTVATSSSQGPQGASSRRLFSALYILFVGLALAVGNDPIVLSGTPFVVYFTNHANIVPPTAFLFAEFQAANLASALLVSSNPTNLVLTSSFGLSFLSFSAWTALPTVAAAVVLYPSLLFIFRSALPDRITPPHIDARSALVDPFGGIFTSTIFLVSIVSLIALSAVGKLEGVEGVWTVTGPAALLVLLRDCLHDVWGQRKSGAVKHREKHVKARKTLAIDKNLELTVVGPPKRADGEAHDSSAPPTPRLPTTERAESVKTVRPEEQEKDVREEANSDVGKGDTTPTPSPSGRATPQTLSRGPSRPSTPSPLSRQATSPASQSPQHSPSTPTRHASREINESTPPPAKAERSASRHPIYRLRKLFPTASLVISRLPFPLVAFAFSMFILVDALDYTGWVEVWARWWGAWARAGGAAGCIWLMGVLAVIGCNIFGTNIGATVLLSRILVRWIRTGAEQGAPRTNHAVYGSVLALAIGSNFGAYSFTFSASLAGLLWRNILRQKGLAVSPREFLRWNLLPLATTMAVGCLVVAAEVCFIFRG